MIREYDQVKIINSNKIGVVIDIFKSLEPYMWYTVELNEPERDKEGYIIYPQEICKLEELEKIN